MKSATMDASIDFALQKPCRFEYAKVLGNGRERHAEGLCQFRNHGFSAGEPRENSSARGVSQRTKSGVQCAAEIVNHTV
jgi:hypothetical protein